MLKLYAALRPSLRMALGALAKISPRFAETLEVRNGLLDRWRKADLGANRLWFHVSSVGELEQVRPALEVLKNRGYSLVLSYFSSSVPRLVKDWSFVRHADYLPLDEPSAMEDLMRIISPRLLVLNRYDIWPAHLQAAKDYRVPVVVVNASTPPLGWFGYFSLRARAELFRMASAWTFVDSAAAAGWEPYVAPRARGAVVGNPRVDRALQRVERALLEKKAEDRLSKWRKNEFCLVAGSTWPEDEEVLLDAWKLLSFSRSLVLVPHEPDPAHLERLEKAIAARGFRSVRFSALSEESDAEVLVVDERGFLAELYRLGELAYVGGGFRKEIHSIIEPVAHGIPVAFGPNFRRSPEAVTLKATGSAMALPKRKGAQLLANWIEKMARDTEARDRAKEALRVFLQIHRGAGERVADFLVKCLGDTVDAAAPLAYADKEFSGILPEARKERR